MKKAVLLYTILLTTTKQSRYLLKLVMMEIMAIAII